MSDLLLMTLGLLAAVLGCLARPCQPVHFTNVKAARLKLEPLPAAAPEHGYEAAPVSEPTPACEPGFADGLSVTA